MQEPEPSGAGSSEHSQESPDRGKRSSRRVVGYVVPVLLWLLIAYPFAARGASDDSGVSGLMGALLGTLAVTLGIAAAVRGIYVAIRKRPFMSPWLFFLAAVFALLSSAGQASEEEGAPPERATLASATPD